MQVILEAIAGPHTGKRIFVKQDQAVRIGRKDCADFGFPRDKYMSGAHFCLELQQDFCLLRDLESSNGTLVNGNKVSEVTVSEGDKIRAGESSFAVHFDTDPVNGLPTAAGAAPPPHFARGLNDDDPAVRRRSLLAAAWSGEKWVLDYCRDICDRPSPENWDAILVLATLGTPDDLPRMMGVAKAAELGPRRFKALGVYGYPGVAELLLESMADDDLETAHAAGAAFTKITGREIDSEVPTAGAPDSFDRPDPKIARAHWEQVQNEFSAERRYASGHDMSESVDESTLQQLDADSQREAYLRKQHEPRSAYANARPR